jgi:hypothetical protein
MTYGIPVPVDPSQALAELTKSSAEEGLHYIVEAAESDNPAQRKELYRLAARSLRLSARSADELAKGRTV